LIKALVEVDEASFELRLDRVVGAPPAAVGDRHAERAGAPRRGRADLAEADDPEPLALDPRPELEEHVPRPRPAHADEPLALAEPPGAHQDQRER